MSDQWGSDAPISRPLPVPDQEAAQYVQVGGMVFGPNGLSLPATEALIQTRYTPMWYPEHTAAPDPRWSEVDDDG